MVVKSMCLKKKEDLTPASVMVVDRAELPRMKVMLLARYKEVDLPPLCAGWVKVKNTHFHKSATSKTGDHSVACQGRACFRNPEFQGFIDRDSEIMSS